MGLLERQLLQTSWICLMFPLCLTQVVQMDQIMPFKKTETAEPQCDVRDYNARFDCYPGYGTTESLCVARGCCWKPVDTKQTTNPGRPISIPYCFFPSNYEGYVITQLQDTDYGYSASLERTTASGWPSDIKKLKLDVWLETSTRVHFKITDPSEQRYEVPISTPKVSKKSATTDYKVTFQKAPFGIKVTRKSTGAVLFDSTIAGAPLIYADQFLQMSTHTGTGLVYGLGEHMAPLLFNGSWTQVSMWNRDINPQFGDNLYGSHPFFLSKESDGKSHGVFLLNSNAMDVDLQPFPALTFRTIGGILDFYIFTGPSSESVIQQYTDIIGKPYMPPYWSLGFHLCRWGYGGSDGLKKVIKRNRDIGFPYDVQWTDIDYMDQKRDWTYSKDQFSDLPDIVSDLHQHGQKYVIIVDPAISNNIPGKYPPYDEGLRDNVFIINNQTKEPLVGQVWPGPTVFPDFTHPNATDWWTRQAQAFYKTLPYDGLWIDMNDPSNEVFGSIHGCSGNQWDSPPYTPGLISGDKLPSRTICPSSLHYKTSHYNLHNMYGLTEAKASYSALLKTLNKRSMVISRSTFPSQGQYGGHWTGDIFSTWQDMQYTIPAMLRFNMFGMPLVGSDICGFGGDTTEELCTRWMQLGAFYPFSRNHNSIGQKDQDPAVFSYRAQKIMKMAYEVRYTLLPFLYTLFYYSHTRGSTVARPLFFEFPLDQQTYGIDRQFMWGSSLLVSPVLEQGKTSVNAYLPKARWYDLYEGHEIQGQGQWMTLDAPLEKINLHMKGGSILPLQEPNVTTTLARSSPFHLLVALAADNTASGDLYWDDGESLGSIENGAYNLITFTASKGQVSSQVSKAGYKTAMLLHTIRVLGVSNPPEGVTVNGKTAKFTYKDAQKELLIEELSLDLKVAFTAQWK